MKFVSYIITLFFNFVLSFIYLFILLIICFSLHSLYPDNGKKVDVPEVFYDEEIEKDKLFFDSVAALKQGGHAGLEKMTLIKVCDTHTNMHYLYMWMNMTVCNRIYYAFATSSATSATPTTPSTTHRARKTGTLSKTPCNSLAPHSSEARIPALRRMIRA
jgi:hypothetical protein